MIDLSNTCKPRQDETAGVAEHILTRIQEAAPSGVWSRTDFLDFGSSYAVEKALQRLVQRGKIRRPLRGLYDRPTKDPNTGRWKNPSILSFVDAIARRDRLTVLVDGMTAAHALGLIPTRPFSTVIYARIRPRLVTIDASIDQKGSHVPTIYRLDFKRFSERTPVFWAGRPSMLLIQAFHLMRDRDQDLNAVAEKVVETMRMNGNGHAVAMDLRLNTAALDTWMKPFILKIADALHQPEDAR
ncbi:hypothetical protein GH983_23425 (plasmid) [Agrobacterium sp. MA01]|uniref:DUF6088 family protein n=1 Tax=Agrobacterium sp. MA01 TaxID=2664893 RepID=UPI00129AE806|nr:DUF6088 family protein [Agrobacterium sp. MA01]QGG93474.1 hypothetical protein GH983_23425 [Agrobacterium sp. MA01]